VQRYAAVWSEQSAGIALPMAAMTVGRGRGKGAIVNQLRFEAGLGHYSVNVAPDSVWIFRGMGTHYFQVQLQIGIPEVGAGAGRLLCVEITLYAPEGSGPRVPLASTNASVPFNPEGEVRMPMLQYLITNAQLLPHHPHPALPQERNAKPQQDRDRPGPATERDGGASPACRRARPRVTALRCCHARRPRHSHHTDGISSAPRFWPMRVPGFRPPSAVHRTCSRE
jgi:hypothetical protein